MIHYLTTTLESAMEDNSTNTFIHGDYEFDEEDFDDAITELLNLPLHTERLIVFVYIDFALIAFFTLELILRLIVCPSLKKYLLSPINVIDIAILVCAYIEVTMELLYAKHRYQNKGIRVFYNLQMLRALRIFRYVQHVGSIKVLGHTLRSAYKDLSVILIFVVMGIVIFSNFVYFAEDSVQFKSIPHGWWWAIITMTTVGYGDMVPKTTIGQLIGSLCAISGVLVLALTVPVFVNTFLCLYQFSRIHDKFLLRKPPTNNKISNNRGEDIPNTGTDKRSVAQMIDTDKGSNIIFQ